MLTAEDIINERKKQEEFCQKYWEEHHPEEVKKLKDEKEQRNQQRLQGKIFNEFTRRWLESEISAARTVLIVGMILTALIKGQVFIWAIMYIAYRGRVKSARQKALEEDWED